MYNTPEIGNHFSFKSPSIMSPQEDHLSIINELKAENFEQAIRIIELFLIKDEFKLKINLKDSFGNTALHILVVNNKVDIIRYILENGAETNILNINGESPLYLSVLINNYEISCILLKYNANPMFSINKQTPYDLAIEMSLESIVNLFNIYLKKEYVNSNLVYSKKKPKLRSLQESSYSSSKASKVSNSILKQNKKSSNDAIPVKTIGFNVNISETINEKEKLNSSMIPTTKQKYSLDDSTRSSFIDNINNLSNKIQNITYRLFLEQFSTKNLVNINQKDKLNNTINYIDDRSTFMNPSLIHIVPNGSSIILQNTQNKSNLMNMKFDKNTRNNRKCIYGIHNYNNCKCQNNQNNQTLTNKSYIISIDSQISEGVLKHITDTKHNQTLKQLDSLVEVSQITCYFKDTNQPLALFLSTNNKIGEKDNTTIKHSTKKTSVEIYETENSSKLLRKTQKFKSHYTEEVNQSNQITNNELLKRNFKDCIGNISDLEENQYTHIDLVNNSIDQFINKINLDPKIAKVLKSNGFDDLNLMKEQMKSNNNYIKEETLKNIGIKLAGTRAKILLTLEEEAGLIKLDFNHNIYYSLLSFDKEALRKNLQIKIINNWLKQIKCEEYLENFIVNGYHSLDLIVFQCLSK